MKKIPLVLSALFAFSAVFGVAACTPAEEIKEIIIKVPRSNTINSIVRPDLETVKELLEEASEEFIATYDREVRIKVIEFAAGEETKAVHNTFGTNDAVDILYDGFFNMSSFIHTGNAVPLDDLLSEEQMGDLSESYLDGGRYNGKLYMLPYQGTQNVLLYNKEIMKKCKLESYITEGETVAQWTADEWTYILNTMAKAIKESDDRELRKCVPMMMYSKDNQGDTHIMTMLRVKGSDLFDENNNFDIADDPDAVEALRWMQNGVKEGWYLPYPHNKTISDNNSKFKMGELGFNVFNLGSPLVYLVKGEGGLDKYGFANFPGGYCTLFSEGFEVYDNGDDEKLEMAKDFLRYFYSTEKWMDCSAGSIPASQRVMQKYKDDIMFLEMFSNNAVNASDYTRNLPNWQGSDNSVRSVFYKEMANLFIYSTGTFTYTPETVAANLQEKLNIAINTGRENSKPHQ